LRWIYGIFGGLETERQELERLTKDQITDILGGSDKAINIPASVIEGIEKGEEYELRMEAKNKYPETHQFKYDLTIENAPGGISPEMVKQNLLWTTSIINLNSGEGFRDFIVIKTQSLPLGTYKMRITLNCLDCTPPQSESEPVIFQVALK
jgi:hypothetical protein